MDVRRVSALFARTPLLRSTAVITMLLIIGACSDGEGRMCKTGRQGELECKTTKRRPQSDDRVVIAIAERLVGAA